MSQLVSLPPPSLPALVAAAGGPAELPFELDRLSSYLQQLDSRTD